MNDQLPRKLAAILYADVAGYSRLTGLDEAGTHKQLSACLDLMADRIRNGGGRVVHYAGDAVLADFDSVIAATRCAIGIQRAIAALSSNYPEERRLLFRIGINLSDVIVDRDDIYGDGVNVAARLEELASPGGVCVSAAVYDQIRGKSGAQFEDLGERVLKNIERPVHAFQLARDSSSANKASTGTISRFAACSNILGGASEKEAAIEFASSKPPSIMILPFKNLSGIENREALVDGFRLSIQSVLVKLSGLFLVNAPVMEEFRTREVTAVDAGNAVGVRYVLEGAVQLADDKVRVTVSLSDSSIGEVVWAESYDRVLEDIFEIQDEITTEIATALEVHLNDVTSDLLAWWEALPNWQVREKALRGISHLYKGSRHDNERARREFSEIIEIMPDQGQGLALVALTHWLDILRGWTDSKSQSIRIATELAERAVQQGDPDGFGRLVLGYARLHQRRHDEAVSLSESATVRRFSCPIARAVYADVLLYSGRPEDAIDEIKYAIRVQRAYPPWMVNVLAEAYRNVGQINPSISVVQESLRLDERNLDARAILCTDYGLSQLSGDARQVARDILRTKPDFTIAGYMKTKPYRETARIDAISSTLREAGLS